jgi:hypothetical protein
MDIDAITNQVAEFHRDRKWILTPDAAAGATSMVEQLTEWGVTDLMIVASIEGVGDVPEVSRIHYTRTSGDTIMHGVRTFLDSVEHPSDDLLEAVDAFDPHDEAMVLGQMFSRERTLAGRPVYGVGPRQWQDLEDKTVADTLWDAAGIPRAPSEVVAVQNAIATAERLAGELGTVWVADNRDGWHGGGEYARWVRDPDDGQSAVDWFEQHAYTVRVMPFLDGIPCSIHAFVTGDGVAVLNPVELLIYRRTDSPAFFYAGGANFWTPPDAIRTEMRTAARRIGVLLDDQMGYRGGFGIDGICTADGFRPTELNPRLSLGHRVHSRSAGFPLESVERMLLEGDIAINASDLEDTVLASATEKHGGALFPLDKDIPAHRTRFVIDGNAASEVDADEPSDGVMTTGPAAFGSMLILRFDPERTPVGPPLAPRALIALDLARELWNVQVPDLDSAPELCA